MTTPNNITFFTSNKIPSGGLKCNVSADSDFPLSNLYNDNTCKVFRTTADNTSMVCSIDLGAAASVDCFALSGHNFSSSGTFKLKWGSTAACTTGSEVLSMTEDHFMWFYGNSGKLNYRYFAFTANENTTDAYYQMAEMWLGEYTELDYNPQIPIEIHKECIELVADTMGGQRWFYPLYNRRGYAFNFVHDFTPAAFTVLENIYKANGRHRPFFFNLKPSDCGNPYSYDTGFFARFTEWEFQIDGKDKRPGSVTIMEEK
jgi:hypothetical protein